MTVGTADRADVSSESAAAFTLGGFGLPTYQYVYVRPMPNCKQHQ